MIRTPRKQATLQLEERKLLLHVEGILLREAKGFRNSGHMAQVQFVTGSFSEDIIINVIRHYSKAGWNVYRHKHSDVNRQPGKPIMVFNYTTLDFS
jgi:hypothetical protein